jgi:predicted patatin/cPLA2 family phospholipase
MTFIHSTNPRDIPGTPEWKARVQADMDEYDSYVPQLDEKASSYRSENPKVVPTKKRKKAA